VARVMGLMGEIVVRGSAPKDTKVFVDGAEVPIVYHFGGLRSVLPTGMIENLEFLSGQLLSLLRSRHWRRDRCDAEEAETPEGGRATPM